MTIMKCSWFETVFETEGKLKTSHQVDLASNKKNQTQSGLLCIQHVFETAVNFVIPFIRKTTSYYPNSGLNVFTFSI